jgi:hypothetical protein
MRNTGQKMEKATRVAGVPCWASVLHCVLHWEPDLPYSSLPPLEGGTLVHSTRFISADFPKALQEQEEGNVSKPTKPHSQPSVLLLQYGDGEEGIFQCLEKRRGWKLTFMLCFPWVQNKTQCECRLQVVKRGCVLEKQVGGSFRRGRKGPCYSGPLLGNVHHFTCWNLH